MTKTSIKSQIVDLELDNTIRKARIERYQNYMKTNHKTSYVQQVKLIIRANEAAIKENNRKIEALQA